MVKEIDVLSNLGKVRYPEDLSNLLTPSVYPVALGKHQRRVLAIHSLVNGRNLIASNYQLKINNFYVAVIGSLVDGFSL